MEIFDSQKHKVATIVSSNVVFFVCKLVFTQQHWLLLLPVALEKSIDSLLFDQVAINKWTPGLKNL